MKKAILITLGAAAVMTMASCRAVQNTAETAQPDILVTTRTAAAETDESNETTTAPSVMTSAEEALIIEKASRKIEITDAVNRTFKVADEPYCFKIPQVTISGVNTDEANKTIKNEIEKKFYENNEEAYDSDYQYFAGNNTVSVIISNMDLFGGEFVYKKVYNIDMNTGKLIQGSEIVKMSGMTDDEFFKKVKTVYTKYNKKEMKNSATKFDKNYVKKNLKKISYKYIQPYFGDNGKLYFIGEVYCNGGAGYSYENFAVT